MDLTIGCLRAIAVKAEKTYNLTLIQLPKKKALPTELSLHQRNIMNQHEQLIEKFYSAFSQKDWKVMQSCYHDEIVFSDPVFTHLKGKEAKAMWHMLAVSAKDFSLIFSDMKADGTTGSCHWEAQYSFSRTGRKVLNKIDAKFEFKDGLIIKHTDYFDFWKWMQMALGTMGLLLGWSAFMRNKIKENAMAGLKKFMTENGYR